MYNLKKVIASICVIALMLTTVAFGATYSDVAEDSAYYEAVETLNKLEIVTGYEDGTYKPEAGVTRAEMAALIARIQGYGDTAAGSANTGFADVPASHWASGYIANAAGMGIINGYGDGNFGPEDPVLYEQAVKMVMATLGYTPYAENNGGYPGGYLAAAQRYDVVAGVANATMGTEANRGTIAQLLVNAIDTPLMAQKTWATDGTAEYVIYDGEDYALKTLMSVNLGYVKIRGIVTENIVTDLDNNTKTIDTSEDETVEIVISDAFDTANKDFQADDYGAYEVRDYLVGSTDAADFIGMSVLAYVKKLDNNDYEIVSIAADTARNKVLTMDLTQFNQINAQGKFEYFKTADAKTATAVVVAGATVVFNNDGGFAVDDIFGDEVANNGATENGGVITLVDNDTTNGYDVIFVDIAETAVVDEAEEGFVAFKEATSVTDLMDLTIDEDDENVIISITKDGEAVAAADLKEWDVLSIIANADGSYIAAEVISNAIVGTIKSVSKSIPSANDYAYTIDNAKYDVAAGAYGIDDLAIGAGGTFYIDKYGKIAAFNEDAALASGVAANYAYVVSTAVDADVLTGENTATVQMVTAEGLVALNIKATNAKINGDTFDADTDTPVSVGSRNTTAKLRALENTVVKYTKNSNDLITAITAAEADEDITTVVSSDAANQTYDAENGKIGTKYVDADALVFFIHATDATESFLGSVADLEDEVAYTVKKLHADEKAEDNNILVVAIASSISPKASMGVLTAMGTSENEDGEEIFAVEVLVNGEVIAAETTADAKDAVENDLTVGDIVKVKVGSDGLISSLEIVYNFADGVRDLSTPFAGVTATEVTSSTDYVGGKVINYKKSSTQATVADNNGNATIKLSQAQNVIVIDANGRDLEIKKSSASNFKAFEELYNYANATVNVSINKATAVEKTLEDAQKAADYVYARLYDGKVVDLVIVKGADMTVRANKTIAVAAATGTHYGKTVAAIGEFTVVQDARNITVTGTSKTIDYSAAGYGSTPANYAIVNITGLGDATVKINKNGSAFVDKTEFVTDGTLDLIVGLTIGDTEVKLDVDGVIYTIDFDAVTVAP